MNLQIFIEGILIGFSVAMPIGPIGILCIQRTLRQGTIAGYLTGFGAATADAIYGSIAAFGITIISNFLIQQQFWIRILGGLAFLFLGLKILLKKEVYQENSKIKKTNLISSYTSSLFLTLTNPITIIMFAGIFSWFKIGINEISSISGLLLISGIFTGSALWFFTLSSTVGLLRYKFSSKHLLLINKLSGLILLVFALIIFLSIAIYK